MLLSDERLMILLSLAALRARERALRGLLYEH